MTEHVSEEVVSSSITKGRDRPEDGETLWLDWPDALERAQAAPSEEFRLRAAEIIQSGVTRVRGAVSPDTCDAVMEEYRAYCREHADDASAYQDERGLHSRLCNFHVASEQALSIGLQPRIVDLLDFLLGYPAAAYSSLLFEKGSEQGAHRDSPFFCTRPEGFFFGVWTALEDVVPGAGELFYYHGGHRVEVDRPRFAGTKGPTEQQVDDYFAAVEDECRRAGLVRATPEMRKGDTLIWHPDVPHGGAPITNPGSTRNSIVYHYKAAGIPVHGPDVYFATDPGPAEDHDPYWDREGRRIVARASPNFA